MWEQDNSNKERCNKDNKENLKKMKKKSGDKKMQLMKKMIMEMKIGKWQNEYILLIT